jgi:hypothetical protein
LNLGSIPEFRVRKLGATRIEGMAEPLPKGLKAACSRAASVGEFVCEKRDGVAALGAGVVNGELGAQLVFELETELGASLAPGRAYRLKIHYMTANDGNGGFSVRTPEKGNTPMRVKILAQGELPASPDAWKTATAEFVRFEDVPVKLVIVPKSLVPGSMVYIRSIEIVEIK